jgi:hypothetical protein
LRSDEGVAQPAVAGAAADLALEAALWGLLELLHVCLPASGHSYFAEVRAAMCTRSV